MATNIDLYKAVKDRSFRKDLLNRINAFEISLPSLRERKEDIPFLVSHLLKVHWPEWQGKLLPDEMEKLLGYEWQEGNIRELRAVLENAVTQHPDQVLTARDLVFRSSPPVSHSDIYEQGIKKDLSPKSFLDVIYDQPETYNRLELDNIANSLKGSLPSILAKILEWSLEVTMVGKELNPTAAVRLILGRDVKTMEAKLFLKKILKLDTKEGTVWKEFIKYERANTNKMIKHILNECKK